LFFRRRQVWVPTLWGWVAFAAAAGVAALALIVGLYPYLAVNAPVGAQVLVVEGWLTPYELDQAIAVFRKGGYTKVVTTGGPLHTWPEPVVDSTFAYRAADYLKRHGLRDVPVEPAPSPITEQDRTFHSALMVRERVRDWARSSAEPVRSLDVVSRGPHARRSRHLYQLAFGEEAKIGVLAVHPLGYDESHWWRSSNGARDVLEQAAGLVWVAAFFHPEAYESVTPASRPTP
jgi:hypothetical protein